MKDGQVDLQEIHEKISDIEERLTKLEEKCGELDSGRSRKRMRVEEPEPAGEEVLPRAKPRRKRAKRPLPAKFVSFQNNNEQTVEFERFLRVHKMNDHLAYLRFNQAIDFFEANDITITSKRLLATGLGTAIVNPRYADWLLQRVQNQVNGP